MAKSRWNAELDAEIMKDDRVVEFVTGRGRTHQSLLARFRTTSGLEWLGRFARGDGRESGIHWHPFPDTACVIAGGWAYIVNVLAPEDYEVAPAYPVTQAVAAPQDGLLILADHTIVLAYGEKGLRWRSGRVSWDGIKLLRVTARGIEGKAWDAELERDVGFFLDPVTGASEGGASPP